MRTGDSDLPSGIVTFVKSDIEGSTRLFRRLGDRYPGVLERHRTLLRSAWTAHGGHEVSTEGDSFFVAFADPVAAAHACIEGQRLLRAEPWREDEPVRVRMGIHTGLAVPHDGDYVAIAAHQLARVSGAANGQQVLLSSETAAKVEGAEGVDLIGLGRFRLPDFDEPERLFQLATREGELAGRVRAIPADGHNLVPPPNSFIGRWDEVAHVAELLGKGRCVSLVGPGGVGKTRLALEVGVQVAPAWPGGVWEVDLARVESAAAVADALGEAIGAPTKTVDRWADALDYLAARSALLFFDNAEPFVEKLAELIPALLRECRDCGVLITSREPLRIAGEQVVRLEPLDIASDGDAPAAVELFLDRAAMPGGTPDAQDLDVIAQICRQVDGLPLAIEIAAARTSVLSPAEILAGLSDMNSLLRSRDRSLPERQRSMQALLDWSYRLLDPVEQAALRRLSVFSGGFSREAAAVVVADAPLAAEDVPELVWALVDRSLLVADLAKTQTSYRFLEPVRQYARKLADESGDTGAAAERAAMWYLERIGPTRSSDRRWFGEVTLELDNLRGIIGIVAAGNAAAAQELACAIGRYRDGSGGFRLGVEEIERFAADLPAPTPARVALLCTLADLHIRVGEIAEAEAVLRDAQELRDRVGAVEWDDAGLERSLGEVALRQGHLDEAVRIASEALAAPISPRSRGRLLNLLGLGRFWQGDHDGAIEAMSLELAQHLALHMEANASVAEGNLAEVAMQLGRTSDAALHQARCLDLALALGLPVTVASSLLLAARIAAATQDWHTAATLQSSADGMLTEIGWRLYDDDQRIARQVISDAREALGEEEFAAAKAMGEAMDTPAAAQLAADVFRLASGQEVAGQPAS